MELLFLVLPLSLLLVAVAVGVFVWASRSGQFDDLETPARRVLFEDDGDPVDQGITDRASPPRAPCVNAPPSNARSCDCAKAAKGFFEDVRKGKGMKLKGSSGRSINYKKDLPNAIGADTVDAQTGETVRESYIGKQK